VVAGFTTRAAQAAQVAQEAQEALAPLRQRDAEAAAALQRVTLERESLRREAKQVADARTAAEQRLQQLSGDLARAQALSRDAEEALKRLDAERQGIEAAKAGEVGEREAAESQRDARALAAAEEEEALAALS